MITVKRVCNDVEMKEVLHIREAVFVKEQNVPVELEIDEYDDISQHFVAYTDGELAGTGRIYKDSEKLETARLGRVAVLPKLRRKGVARAIIERILDWARSEEVRQVTLHAQLSSIELYKEFGFNIKGNTFMEAGISHTVMSIDLLDSDLESDISNELDFAGGVC